MKKRWMKPAAVLLWFLIWFAAAFLVNDAFKFPGPMDTLGSLFSTIAAGDGFLKTVGASLLRILTGFLLSCVLGLLLGTIAGLKKNIAVLLEPIVTVIKSTPVMSFIILAMIWFKFAMVPVLVCFLMCFPIMYSNVKEGIINTDTKLLDMAKLYRVKKLHVLGGIYLKSIKPYFYSAADVCLGLGFKVTVAAEVLVSPDYGIGSRLYDAKVYLEPVEVFAWTFVILILSYIMEQLLKAVFIKKLKGAKEYAADDKKS